MLQLQIFCMEWPVFSGTQKEKVEKITDWLLKNIKPRSWSKEDVNKLLFSRSPEQIVKDGHSYYMLSCVDIGSVAAELLFANGFQPTLVLEKHKKKGKEGTHFSVEFSLNGKPTHFKITRTVIEILPGLSTKTETRPILLKLPLKTSKASTPYWELFGVRNLQDLRKKLQSNNLELFERSTRRVPGRVKRANIMARRASFRVGRTIKKPFKRR